MQAKPHLSPLMLLYVLVIPLQGCLGVNPSVPAHTQRLPSLNIPRAACDPELGGEIDHPSWEGNARIIGLSPAMPVRVAECGETSPLNTPRLALDTQVLLVWRPNTLFIRFVCDDGDVFSPYGHERDALHYKGDVVEVFLDAVGDGRQWFEIQLSPAGGVLDLNTVLSAPPRSNECGLLTAESNRNYWSDRSYDLSGLRTATRLTEHGWIADFALPAAAILRRDAAGTFAPGRTMRLNLIRYDRSPTPKGNSDANVGMGCWSPVVFGRPHRSPTRMGEIVLVDKQLRD
ncbi:MAG: carbohydrate-binding family 9-like protein [Planctomycetota bacterium]